LILHNLLIEIKEPEWEEPDEDNSEHEGVGGVVDAVEGGVLRLRV